MATTNTTGTIVAFKYIPIMLEADWEFICFNNNPNAFRSLGDGSAVLLKQGLVETRARDGLEKGLLAKRGEQEDDEVSPLCTGALIPAPGDTLRLAFDEPVIPGPSGSKGFKLTASGGPALVKFQSVLDGNPNMLVFQISRKILKAETCLLSYTQPVGGLQDIAGNDLLTFNDKGVNNNSNA